MNKFLEKILFVTKVKKINDNQCEIYIDGRLGALSYILYGIYRKITGQR